MFSVIVVNYKQKSFITECVKSLINVFKSCPIEIIIINNSPEEKLNDLKIISENISIYENKNNGFGHANNLGATYSKGEYLFFLNADTLVKNDFLKDLSFLLQKENTGLVGLKLYYPEGTFQLSFWKENNIFNEFINKKNEKKFKNRNINYIKKLENSFGEIKTVEWVSGAAMVIPACVFNKMNGFDEDYFLFYEDADLCKRISKSGYEIYFYPFSEIIHYKGENVNSDFYNDTYFYSKKSQILYYKKNNNVIQYILLIMYLLVRFSVLYIFTFKKIYLKILKLILWGRNNKNP